MIRKEAQARNAFVHQQFVVSLFIAKYLPYCSILFDLTKPQQGRAADYTNGQANSSD